MKCLHFLMIIMDSFLGQHNPSNYFALTKDGSNLASGPNSSIPLSDNHKELSTISEEARLDRESILEKVRNGVANQIDTGSEKGISKDDASVK